MKRILFLFLSILSINGLYTAESPRNHSFALQSAIEETFHAEPESIDPLTNGLRSPGVYKITIAQKTYVARFSNQNQTEKEKEDEWKAMHIASEQDIAPKIIYSHLSKGIVILEFVSSMQQSVNFNPLEDKKLVLLAEKIRKIHNGAPFNERLSYAKKTKFFAETLSEDCPSVFALALTLLEKLDGEVQDSLIIKPCHNDLIPRNLLYTQDNIYIIDWEYAAQSDPFFDLATPIIFYLLNNEQEKTFLKGYFERELLPAEEVKLLKVKQMIMILYGFGFIRLSLDGGVGIMSEKEVDDLPSLDLFLLNFLRLSEESNTPEFLHQFGFAFLKKAVAESQGFCINH